MNKIKILSLAIFFILVLLPMLSFRTEEELVSDIDNRKLAGSPLEALRNGNRKNVQKKIQDYVNDRIGFRSEMIMAYTILNDRVFGEMVHPSYTYGRNGYVFGRNMKSTVYNHYHDEFVNMTTKLADYCSKRGVPFVFVFEPLKHDLYPEYLPAGVNYDNRWASKLMSSLNSKGIRCVNNTDTMLQAKHNEEIVYNQKYDALHWNDRGRFYGSNAILQELGKSFPAIKTNHPEIFEWGEVLNTSLPVSMYPIEEKAPYVSVPMDDIEDITNLYKEELNINPKYPYFSFTRNYNHLNDIPRVLIFQGSFLNNDGRKFLAYALGEYISIHDYENIINLPYYFNIFKPKCVVFEVAEFSLQFRGYFKEEYMKKIDYNPTLESVMKSFHAVPAPPIAVNVKHGKALTVITWEHAENAKYVWLLAGDEFDMQRVENGIYEVTIKNEDWDKGEDQAKIAVFDGSSVYIHNLSE